MMIYRSVVTSWFSSDIASIRNGFSIQSNPSTKLHSKYNLPSSTQPDHTQYEVLLQIDL